MPTKGSQHDQMKTLDMAQVKSGDLTSCSIITMRIAEAMQTLAFFLSANGGKWGWRKQEGTHNPPRSNMPPTKIFLVVGRLRCQTGRLVAVSYLRKNRAIPREASRDDPSPAGGRCHQIHSSSDW